MATKLVNPRGRTIVVEDTSVSSLLKRGFVFPPEDQKGMRYSQVHDKGADNARPYRKEKQPAKLTIERLGDVLPVDTI